MTDLADNRVRDLNDAVSSWLLAHDRGLSTDEVRAFDLWLLSSPVHGRAWAEAASLWMVFDGPEADVDLLELLEDARTATPAPGYAPLRPLRLVIGSGLLLSAVLAWLVMQPAPPPPINRPVTAEQSFATARRAVSYRMADGTQLALDAGSSMSFVVRGNERLATLTRGRAFLEVHHDPKRPFRLVADGATITDVGTRFGVSSERGGITVTLLSGKVAIVDPASGGDAVQLVPGQQFKRTGTAPGQISTINGDHELSWRNGHVDFDNEPLTTAVAEMNRYTAEPIEIGDAEIGRYRISGRFKAGDTERFARSLALVYPVTLTTDQQGRPTLRIKR